MSLISLLDARSRLVVRNGQLAVEQAGVVVETLPVTSVQEVHLHGQADLTAAARNLLLRHGIDVVLLRGDGRVIGRLSSYRSNAGDRRLAWLRLVLDEPRRLALSKQIVAGKIRNQRAVALRRQRRVRDDRVADALAAMRTWMVDLNLATSLDAVRGYEGAAAAQWFAAFGKLLTNKAFVFDGRNRYPPKDPVNACLSYGYAMLLSRVEHAVWAAGLDPYVGVLHEAGRGAPALALDLMEEWRPLVDDLVLTLLNRGELTPEDFRHPANDELGLDAEPDPSAVLLDRTGKTVLIEAWTRALGEPVRHPTRENVWTVADMIKEQALQAAALAEGRQIDWQAVELSP